MQKIIVVSAVNIVEGGALTVLLQCLSYLNDFVLRNEEYRVIALVHDRQLCYFPDIEYVERRAIKSSWLRRLKFEFFDCLLLSRKLRPYLWLSLHDISPNVCAGKRAVYCHNPTPFHKVRLNELRFDYKVVLFTLFYKFLYKINIHKNDFIIVQQDWMRNTFSKYFNVDKNRIIVSYPLESRKMSGIIQDIPLNDGSILFFYPSYPRSFKNFEIICQAVSILNKRKIKGFTVQITLNGTENRYSGWLFKKYKHIGNMIFSGLLPLNEVHRIYEQTDCLLFPSRLETWGLPVSEFGTYNKPILAADLPYAHETASNCGAVCFFNPVKAADLANRMEEVIRKDFSHFEKCRPANIKQPFTQSWEELFHVLLTENLYSK